MPTKTTTVATRNASLDAARGVLMILGIVLHTANIYAVGANWLVWDAENSLVFNTLRDWIHVFRMPTFFWISGYFCALTFSQGGARSLISKRLPRLFLPLITTWLTLNVIQMVAVDATVGSRVNGILNTSIPMYHLWFLVDLAVYIAFAALLLPALRSFGSLGKRLENIPTMLLLPALAAISVSISIAGRATGIAYASPLELTSLFRLASGATFFAAGIFMYHHVSVRKAMLNTPVVTIVAAVPLAVYAKGYSYGHGLVVGEIALYVEYLMTWFCVAVILRLAHDIVRSESPVTRFLSDSAYTIFLFHHLLVFTLGYALIDYPLGPWIKFLLVCTGSFALASLIHYGVIRRSRVARLLFNGK